jgi:hypothetical protein
MAKIILAYAINLILTEIARAGAAVDWAGLKATVDAQIKAAMPALLDPTLEGIANQAIDDVAALLQDQADLSTILTDVTGGNWAQALVDLEALAQKVFVNPTASQKALMAVLKAA